MKSRLVISESSVIPNYSPTVMFWNTNYRILNFLKCPCNSDYPIVHSCFGSFQFEMLSNRGYLLFPDHVPTNLIYVVFFPLSLSCSSLRYLI